jgi:hypothetical protein
MRVNIITRGQRVRVNTHGANGGRLGTVTRIRFYADAKRVHYEARVLIQGRGTQTIPLHFLEVA